jgi:hypothetical protein
MTIEAEQQLLQHQLGWERLHSNRATRLGSLRTGSYLRCSPVTNEKESWPAVHNPRPIPDHAAMCEASQFPMAASREADLMPGLLANGREMQHSTSQHDPLACVSRARAGEGSRRRTPTPWHRRHPPARCSCRVVAPMRVARLLVMKGVVWLGTTYGKTTDCESTGARNARAVSKHIRIRQFESSHPSQPVRSLRPSSHLRRFPRMRRELPVLQRVSGCGSPVFMNAHGGILRASLQPPFPNFQGQTAETRFEKHASEGGLDFDVNFYERGLVSAWRLPQRLAPGWHDPRRQELSWALLSCRVAINGGYTNGDVCEVLRRRS